MKHISQREAQRLKKKVLMLESRESRRFAAWTKDFPGGVNIDAIALNDIEAGIVAVAEKLGYAIVAKADGKVLYLYAIKP